MSKKYKQQLTLTEHFFYYLQTVYNNFDEFRNSTSRILLNERDFNLIYGTIFINLIKRNHL